MPLLPYVRRELFLQAIKNRDASALPDPNNREELFLKAIAEETALIPTGVSVVLPAAVSEMLANLPEAHTHTELFYKEILDTILTASTVTDTTPFISRETAGGLPVSGTAELKKKLGNTVGVNQLQRTQTTTATSTYSGVTISNSTKGVHLSGTATADIGIVYFDRSGYSQATIPGHTYLLFGCPSGGNGKYYIEPLMGAGADWCKGYPRDTGSGVIFVAKKTNDTPDYIYGIRLYIVNGASNLNADVNCYLIDLDRWFGSTDRIPSDLLSHPENRGRYYAGSLAYAAGYLDSADGTMLTSKGSDGTTVLASVDTGSEVLRSAGAVADEKTPDGTITRRVGVVDLGTVNWVYDAGDTRFYFSGLDYKRPESNAEGNAICSYFVNVKLSNLIDKSICLHSNGYVYAKDSSYTSGAALKTAMSGVYLYYELATPTTEQGTAFDPVYDVEYGGTESWTNLKGIPQGHETEYTEYTT